MPRATATAHAPRRPRRIGAPRAAAAAPRVLVAQPMQGAWRLRVSDHAATDVGTLNGWSLEIDHDG